MGDNIHLMRAVVVLILLLCGVLLAFSFLLHSASAASLPADVSLRVGRAQSFTYAYTPDQYQHSLGARDYIWNNQPSQAQGPLLLPAGTLSSAYIAVARVPPWAEAYGPTTVTGWDIAWFRAHHPEWILLGKDHATPAYEYGDAWVPLDYTNPAVQAWRRDNEILPILAAGYQGISVDNVTVQNDFDREGVCSVAVPTGQTPPATCESAGGRWTQIWSGQVLGDAKFVTDQVAWLRVLAGYVHSQRSAALSVNITYNPADLAGTAALIAAADIWYDEAGFTGDSEPSACDPAGGGSGVVGQAWIDKANFINARGVPNVQENSICPLGDARSQGVLDYAVASYLLTKNAHSYGIWYFDDTANFTDASPGGAWAELSWAHGAAQEPMTAVGGVYRRRFANGVALLNPGAVGATYDLGTDTYKDFAGNAVGGVVSLGPASAKVLAATAVAPATLPCHVTQVIGATVTFTCDTAVDVTIRPH